MKKLIIFAFILSVLVVQPLSAQNNNGASIFNRLLIFNAKNELLVVRVHNSENWLTPGFYQSDEVSIRKGLIYTASLYGISISEPKLHGVFILKRETNNKLSYRNMFMATTKDVVSKMPEIVAEAKWMAVDRATRLTSFPHIDTLIKQVALHPDTVWGGSLTSYQEGKVPRSKMTENFYPLFGIKNRANK